MLNLELLYRHPIFSLADRRQLSGWAESAQLRRMTTGELLCREHERAQSLFVVQSGRVRVLKKSEDNREITVGTCKTGELIGDYSLLEPHRCAATCRVSADAQIWSLPLAPGLLILRNSLGHGSLRPWLKLQFLCRFLRNECYLGFMSGGSFLPLLDHCQNTSFEAGETIQAAGLFADSAFVVVNGRVTISDDFAESKAKAVRASGLFGIEALLSQSSVPCVTAETPLECWQIPRHCLFGSPDSDGSLQSLGQERRTVSLHFPFVGQQSATECGCASLAMAARFHRLPVTLETIRQSTSLHYRGASIDQLMAAAERIGMNARAVKIADHHLTGVTFPAIAHLNSDHYVVVYDADREAVVVGDPAVGIVRHSRSQFQKLWNGVLLLLQPAQKSC